MKNKRATVKKKRENERNEEEGRREECEGVEKRGWKGRSEGFAPNPNLP